MASASARPGELRLEVVASDLGAPMTVLVHRRDAGPAWTRTRFFDIGYSTNQDGKLAPAMAEVLTDMVRCLEAPQAARCIMALLDCADHPERHHIAGRLTIDSPWLASDGRFFEESRLPRDADPNQCNRRAESVPRSLGWQRLVVTRDGTTSVYAPVAPGQAGDPLYVAKNGHGHARLMGRSGASQGTSRPSFRLTLMAICQACPALHDCPGWFGAEPEPTRPESTWALAEQHGSDLLEESGRAGAAGGVWSVLGGTIVRDLARRLQAAAGAPAGEAPPGPLLVDAAQLLDPLTARSVAEELQGAIRDRVVLVVGREPEALALEGGTAQDPGAAAADPFSALQAAEAATAARKLRELGFVAVGARLAGAHGARLWWLRCVPEDQAAHLARPRHVSLIANRRCVTVCRYCDLPIRLEGNTSLHDALAAMEETAVLGAEVLEFFGGEVTLRADLFAMLAYARHLGLETCVTTTGVGLDQDKLQRLVDARVGDLAVSLDSADPAIHDDLKNREGMHAAGLAAATAFKRMGAQRVVFNTVITPTNFRGLPEVLKLAADSGLDGATLFLCQPVAEFGNETPLLSLQEATELLTDILPRCRDLARRYRLNLGVRPSIDLEDEPASAVAERVASGTYSRIFATDEPCSICDDVVALHPNGDVRLCNQPILQFDPDAVVGNLRDQSLARILASERAVLFRARAGRLDLCRYCTFDHGTQGPAGSSPRVAEPGPAEVPKR